MANPGIDKSVSMIRGSGTPGRRRLSMGETEHWSTRGERFVIERMDFFAGK